MAIDVRGFNSGDVDFSGLYKAGDTLYKNKLLDERRAERDQHEKDRQEARRASMASFLTDFADPKDHLSGEVTDPQVTKGYFDMLQKGTALLNNNKGLSQDMLLMALSGDAARLAEYSSKAKTISQQIKAGLSGIPESSGYDKFKLEKAAKRSAFFNPDGSQIDVAEVNPNIDYVGKAVKENPYEVTNNKGLDEWLSKQNKFAGSSDIISTNAAGGKERRKTTTTAYAWAVPEVNEQGVHTRKFIPEYDHAYDGQDQILHEGKPVHVVTHRLYKSVLSNSPGTADWLRGQVSKALESGEYKDSNGDVITEKSPHADLIAKQILFDELKVRGLGGMQDIVESKANPVDKFYAHYNFELKNPLAGGNQQVIDLYNGDKNNKGLKEIVTENELAGHKMTRFNQLPISAQNVILKNAKENSGDHDLNYSNVYVNSLPTGELVLRKVPDNGRITEKDATDKSYLSIIDPESLNIPINVAATKVGTGKGKVGTINKTIDTGAGNKSPDNKTEKGLPIFK